MVSKCPICWSYDEHHWACNLNNLYKESNELKMENKRLREALSGVRSAIKNNLPDVAIEMADEELEGGRE